MNSKDSAVTKEKYDYAGRLVEVEKDVNVDKIDGQVYRKYITTSTAYNPEGTIKSTTDANGYTTYYFYDNVMRLDQQFIPYEATNNAVSSYVVKKFIYDYNGNKVKEMVLKDKVSSVQKKDDISQSICYVSYYDYDYKNRLILSIGYEGKRVGYHYDADGNIDREDIYTDGLNAITTVYVIIFMENYYKN